MGFNKRFVPELDVLVERRKNYSSDEEFLSAVVGKSDALIGSSESIDYLDQIYDNIKKEKDSESRDY
jgi:hypothetical protein